MLNFVTGQPGDGKTLYTISTVIDYKEECDKSKDENLHGRQVWYHGIKGLAESLGWHKFDDPHAWIECPAGSIIIIDEAQEVFPPKPQGSTRPESYNKFATHRHHGFDIYLITQNAMNVDFKVRSMCNVHWHISRNFGREAATVYRFKEIQKPNDYHAKKAAIKSAFTYPKKIYALYKSAEVHTHKPKLPWKQLGFYGGLFLLLPVVVYFAATFIMGTGDRALGKVEENIESIPTNQNRGGNNKRQSTPINRFTVESFKPEMVDRPYTAPIYASLVRVKSYPKVSGCSRYQFGRNVECTCNDQQGNTIHVSSIMCETYIKRGVFDFTLEQTGQAGERRGLRAIPATINNTIKGG